MRHAPLFAPAWPAADLPIPAEASGLVHRAWEGRAQPDRTVWPVDPSPWLRLVHTCSGELHFTDRTGSRSSDPLVLIGPSCPGHPFRVAPLGDARFHVFELRPSAVHALTREPLNGIRGQVMPASRLFGDHLVAHEGTADHHALLAAVSEGAEAQPPLAERPGASVLERAIHAHGGNIGVEALAGTLGCSVRQLQRRALRELGNGPKAHCALVRLARFRDHVRHTGDQSLDITLTHGFYDRAHMQKEVRRWHGRPDHPLSRPERP